MSTCESAVENLFGVLKRAGISTASAELLLVRMRSKVDDRCRERDAFWAERQRLVY
jgi:hypothetical protein